MKNKKIRRWIILIIIVIAGILALLVALKHNKKENPDQVVNADGAIVKENVQVINEENAPDQVTENTLVYISNNPKYKKGDVLVSGIIDGADAGFIRRVTNVSKKNDVYVYETEPALLTDVFEEAHIIRRFQLKDDGIEEVGFSNTNSTDGIMNNASYQTNVSHFVVPLSKDTSEKEEEENQDKQKTENKAETDKNTINKEKDENESDGKSEGEDVSEHELSFSGEKGEGPFSISYSAGVDAWIELSIEIEDGDIQCGISVETKAEANISADYEENVEKEIKEKILSKKLPNYQFWVGMIPIVVTNKIEATVGLDASLTVGSIEIGYNPSVESSLGFMYDSKNDKIKPIKKYEKNIDSLQWDSLSGVAGSVSADIGIHYITKLYGEAGIDISAGIYGSAEGETTFSINENAEKELSGKLDLAIGPQLEGSLVVDVPVFSKTSFHKKIFDTKLEPFWSRHWEVAASTGNKTEDNSTETDQENEQNPSEIGNQGTIYRTRFADVNQLDACRFQFDIPPGWKVESEQVGALMDVIQEQVVITNDRGVTVTYWDLPQELGGRSGVVMEQVNITKAADTDFMWSVRDPTDEADLLNTENYMVARIQTIGSLDVYEDTEFTPADGTRFALLPVSELGEREFKIQAGDVDEFSFNYYGLHAFIAEAPDGNFTAKEEKEVIQILQSFKEY